jgi:hypothetical protein
VGWIEMTNHKLAERRRQSAVNDGFGVARARSRCQLGDISSHLLDEKRDKDKTKPIQALILLIPKENLKATNCLCCGSSLVLSFKYFWYKIMLKS